MNLNDFVWMICGMQDTAGWKGVHCIVRTHMLSVRLCIAIKVDGWQTSKLRSSIFKLWLRACTERGKNLDHQLVCSTILRRLQKTCWRSNPEVARWSRFFLIFASKRSISTQGRSGTSTAWSSLQQLFTDVWSICVKRWQERISIRLLTVEVWQGWWHCDSKQCRSQNWALRR